MDAEHTPILKRVGAVLLVLGLVDIAVMIYWIANRISYSSSFNVFALGPGYRFHVSSLSMVTSGQGTSVSGVVTAWNDNEIRAIPVQWEER